MTPPEQSAGHPDPFTMVVHPERRFVHVIYHRQPGFLEWRRIMRALLARPDVGPEFGILIDRSEVFHPANTVYAQSVAHFIEHEAGSRPWAMVVAGPASLFMARMMEGLIKHQRVAVFSTLAEAEAWLSK